MGPDSCPRFVSGMMMMWHLPTGMRMELEPKDFLFYFESGSHKIVLAGLELNSEIILSAVIMLS